MLSDNIRKFRSKKNMTQEDVAISMNVVRQTVSKWEKNLSVPDADQLIKLSEILDVSVNELLSITSKEPIAYENIADELENANSVIANLSEQSRLEKESNKVRGLILFLVIVAIIVSSISKSSIVSLLVFGSISIISLVILYRNIGLLTAVTSPNADLKPIRITTIFNITVILVLFTFVGLTELGVLSLSSRFENGLAILIVSTIIIFSGIVSPKLPFNKHTGLRLPWTVYDEDTWNIAHRILGIISLPLAIAYIALSFFISDFEKLSLFVILIWIGVPALISLLYYLKKFKFV